MADRISYTLQYPITVTLKNAKGEERTETITEVTHPVGIRMKGRDMRAVGDADNPVDATLLMIAHFTGLTRAQVDEMDTVDIEHLQEVVGSFRSGPKTGPTS